MSEKTVWLTVHADTVEEGNRLMDVVLGRLAPWVPDEPPEPLAVEEGFMVQVYYTLENVT